MYKIFQESKSLAWTNPTLKIWSQFIWESHFKLTYGVPAIVALNFAEREYAVQKGAFDETAIRNFLDRLTTGRIRTNFIGYLPPLIDTTPWDGKDPVIESEAKSEL